MLIQGTLEFFISQFLGICRSAEHLFCSDPIQTIADTVLERYELQTRQKISLQ